MASKPVILFRSDRDNGDEQEVARKHFEVVNQRAACRDRLVIGRYSVLPFYDELQWDLSAQGSRLINSRSAHRYIADFDYYKNVGEYTFKTWTEAEFPRSDHPGPFVVKGATNSRKYSWNKLMFAKDRCEAVEVACRLKEDAFIGTQPLLFREYVPLVTYEIGLNDLRFTNEWRFFFLGGRRLAHGYYWSEADDVTTPKINQAGFDFVAKIAEIVSRFVPFFVLDIGEKQDGGWILIEVNDAQMSGLSMVDPEVLYANLARTLQTY